MAWRYRRRGERPGFCRECGEDVVLTSSPSALARIRHFLVFGMPAPEVFRCSNGHETSPGWSATSRGWRVPGRRRRIAGLVRAIRGARSIEPVPLTYLGAGAIGGLVGVVLELWLGLRWWVVSGGVVAAAWAFFASNAFWPSNRRDLSQRLRYALDPARAHRMELEELADSVERGEVVAYGVPGWSGEVGLGGWTGSDGAVTSLVLAHHSPGESSTPAVEVESHRHGRRLRTLLEEQVVEDFVVRAAEIPDADPSEELGRRLVRRRWEAMRAPLPAWGQEVIRVDGREVAFATLRGAGYLVGIADIDEGALVVRAAGVEPAEITIERLSGIRPYVAGTLERIRAGRRHPEV